MSAAVAFGSLQEALAQRPGGSYEASTRVAAAGTRWKYPSGRPDPTVPPNALYSAPGTAELLVAATMVNRNDSAASSAVVQLGSDAETRRLVRVGHEIGRYRIERIERTGLVVSVESLGTRREERFEASRPATKSNGTPSPR